MKNKKVVILQHNRGQLANQLWNFATIYAYCLEKGYICKNYSFFEYNKYFNIKLENKLIDLLFFRTFNFFSKFLPFKFVKKIFEFFYSVFASSIKILKKKQFIYAGHSIKKFKRFYYLPPTQESKDKLKNLELNKEVQTIYLEGWLFRNPIGLIKFQRKIRKYFKPKYIYTKRVDKFISTLRRKYSHLVGVHIRQKSIGDGNLNKIKGEKVYIFKNDINFVKRTLEEYLLKFNKFKKDVCFVVCSNKKVNISKFKGLNIVFAGGNPVEDLYTLSKMDIIIGCRSTFSTFAAYYGNIPLVIFNENKINWDYYIKNKLLY